MSNLIIPKTRDAADDIRQMRLDAAYDVESDETQRSLCVETAISDIKSRPAPPTVPKMFVSNDCAFNCAYCGCRATRDDKQRYCCEPKNLAALAVEEAKRNGRGVFITSAINKNADRTEELIIETIKIMRRDLGYGGYIHAKVMPGTDPALIHEAGKYADRLSVNIEVAKSEGYSLIAKQKNKKNILTPMFEISEQIKQMNAEKSVFKPKFATSQTTQLMAGSSGEDDRTILNLSSALYSKLSLKRVYYTAFTYTKPAVGYDLAPVVTPKRRMRRLYQADRLMQLYGFSPDEITPTSAPFLDDELDPKTAAAIRNIKQFPVEINRADYETLLRVPGIGEVYVKRILAARRFCAVTPDILFSKIGVSPKKSSYFITISGKWLGGKMLDDPSILRRTLSEGELPCEQLTLF